MSRTRHWAGEIVNTLRQTEVELRTGQSIARVAKKLEITDRTCDRWRREYGGMKVDQARRLKELEQENARLGRVVAALTQDSPILKEAARPDF